MGRVEGYVGQMMARNKWNLEVISYVSSWQISKVYGLAPMSSIWVHDVNSDFVDFREHMINHTQGSWQ